MEAIMHILLALDQSKFSGKVLDQAVDLAKRCGAQLTILTVAEQFHDDYDFGEEAARVDEKLVARAKAGAEEARAKAAAQGVTAEVVVETGVSPEDNIIRLAEERKADMLVMGHRGRTGLSRFLIGSVAGKVVAHAPCSVLVVK
jgi:nucleotide-binding universal stress UspA family protein